MTLTLDEVRKTRFHMSRRNGYEVTDVDLFVDKVEATLTQLAEESDALRRQVSAGGGADNSEDLKRLNQENAVLREQLEALRQAASGDDLTDEYARAQERIAEITSAYADLQGQHEQALQAQHALQLQLQELRESREGMVAQPSDASVQLGQENEHLRAEVEELRARLAEASRVAAAAPAPIPAGPVGNTPLQRLIVTTSAEASPAVVRLVQLATEQAEQLVTEAQHEAQRRLDAADQKAHDLATQARAQADRLESEARVNAERATAEAQARAKSIENEANERRAQMFSALESEREQLIRKVEALRGFEAGYRSNLTQHLQNTLQAVQSGSFEPADGGLVMSDVNNGGFGSATPRLDALLSQDN